MDRDRGYHYTYRFSIEDEIIPLYSTKLCYLIVKDGLKKYLFEIRTNFKLKRVDDDDGGVGQMMGSERFGGCVGEGQDEWWLEHITSFRLKDYWMSDDEIQSLVRDAFDFAKQMAGDPQHASRSVIPVVVGLDVWTVQQEGEPINATIERAIRPESLIPIYVWPVIPDGYMQLINEYPYLARKSFLWMLPRIRVEDEAGLGLMDVCPVCWRNSVIGAQISFLPCKHACHSHCVFHWLRQKNCSCPLCGFRIPTDSEKSRRGG